MNFHLEKKQILVLASLIILAASLPFVIRFAQMRQEIRPEAKEVKESFLSLAPKEGTFKPNEAFTVTVQLNTGGTKISGTDIVLNYNPQMLEVVSLDKKEISGLRLLKKDHDAEKGIIYATFILSDFDMKFANQNPQPLLEINFKGRKEGRASLEFDSRSGAGTGGGEIFLGNVQNGNYALSNTASTEPKPEVTPPSPLPSTNIEKLPIRLKFGGISEKSTRKPIKKAKITIPGTNIKDLEITLTPDASGFYNGEMALNLPPGNYQILIKEGSSLPTKLSLTLDPQKQSVDLTQTQIPVGKLDPNSKRIGMSDIALLLKDYDTKRDSAADFNGDGTINMSDLAILLTNYDKVGDD